MQGFLMKGRVQVTGPWQTEAQAGPLPLGPFRNMKEHIQTGRYIRPRSQSHYHRGIYHALGGDCIRLAMPKNRPGRKRWKEIQNICLLSLNDKQSEGKRWKFSSRSDIVWLEQQGPHVCKNTRHRCSSELGDRETTEAWMSPNVIYILVDLDNMSVINTCFDLFCLLFFLPRFIYINLFSRGLQRSNLLQNLLIFFFLAFCQFKSTDEINK